MARSRHSASHFSRSFVRCNVNMERSPTFKRLLKSIYRREAFKEHKVMAIPNNNQRKDWIALKVDSNYGEREKYEDDEPRGLEERETMETEQRFMWSRLFLHSYNYKSSPFYKDVLQQSRREEVSYMVGNMINHRGAVIFSTLLIHLGWRKTFSNASSLITLW